MGIGPDGIFNADETGVLLNPKPPPVLTPKGSKNVYNIVNNNEKENVTVLMKCKCRLSFIIIIIIIHLGNASEDLAPPLMVKVYQKILLKLHLLSTDFDSHITDG